MMAGRRLGGAVLVMAALLTGCVANDTATDAAPHPAAPAQEADDAPAAAADPVEPSPEASPDQSADPPADAQDIVGTFRFVWSTGRWDATFHENGTVHVTHTTRPGESTSYAGAYDARTGRVRVPDLEYEAEVHREGEHMLRVDGAVYRRVLDDGTVHAYPRYTQGDYLRDADSQLVLHPDGTYYAEFTYGARDASSSYYQASTEEGTYDFHEGFITYEASGPLPIAYVDENTVLVGEAFFHRAG